MPTRFANLDPSHRPPGFSAVFRWAVWDRVTFRRRVRSPEEPARRVDPDLEQIHNPGGSVQLTWIGHASFLLSLGGCHILIDPVFSPRIGVFYKRHVPPGLIPEQLPPVDAVLVSHNHYDHLDARSIAALSRDVKVIVPLRLGGWFRRRGFANVVELDWWQSTQIGDNTVTLVPARHWSRRRPFDGNHTLWGGFVITSEHAAVFHAGDSAWFDGFAEIGRRFPNLDVAMLPIGGYEPAWFMDRNHMNPEQAGRAYLDCGAKTLVPMHWGTFQMTDEPLSEPAERLRNWWQNHQPDSDRRLHIPAVGETMAINRRGVE